MAGGPEPARAVRPQAEAARSSTARRARRRSSQGKRFAFIKGDAKLLGTRRKFAAARPVRRPRSASCLPHLASVADDICHRPQHGRPTSSTTARPSCSSTPARRSSAGRAWASWVTYGIGSESQDLPGFVVLQSGPARPARRRAAAGAAASCRRPTRACRSAPAASRSSTSTSPTGVDAERQRRVRRRGARPEPAAAGRRRATRRSPRASPPTRWPTGCRPAPRS